MNEIENLHYWVNLCPQEEVYNKYIIFHGKTLAEKYEIEHKRVQNLLEIIGDKNY